jgi:hypothetical protein
VTTLAAFPWLIIDIIASTNLPTEDTVSSSFDTTTNSTVVEVTFDHRAWAHAVIGSLITSSTIVGVLLLTTLTALWLRWDLKRTRAQAQRKADLEAKSQRPVTVQHIYIQQSTPPAATSEWSTHAEFFSVREESAAHTAPLPLPRPDSAPKSPTLKRRRTRSRTPRNTSKTTRSPRRSPRKNRARPSRERVRRRA